MKRGAWSEDEDETLRRLHGSMKKADLAKVLNRSHGSVRARCTTLSIDTRVLWTKQETESLVALYEKAGVTGVLGLSDFAVSIGRSNSNVCRKAKDLGLSVSPNRKKVEVRKDRRKFETKEELSAYMSNRQKEWLTKNGHPRGMKGKKHSQATKEVISATSKAAYLFMTEERKSEIYMKVLKTKVAKYGSAASPRAKTTWAAGWREFGGRRTYYRSRWEANYARYLQWLKEQGEIVDWQHEPETFWFEEIKRGVRSYLPDFRVWENNGEVNLHEVKGWMDARSKTTLKRMKKYHPEQKIVLIDTAQYKAIRRKVMGLVPGWEDSDRDARI